MNILKLIVPAIVIKKIYSRQPMPKNKSELTDEERDRLEDEKSDKS